MPLPSHHTATTFALLVVHVAAGFTAFVVAPGAMLTRPGSVWHRRWGKIYYWSMAVVAGTALPIAVLRPNLFLFLVALFSFYLAFSGRRVLRRKRPDRGDRATALDWTAVAILGIAGLSLVTVGAVSLVRGSGFGTVAVVFGALSLTFAARDGRAFRHPPTERKAWLITHITNMCGAYIATVSAFSAVNLAMLPPVVRWLWPTLIGVPLILRRIRRERAPVTPSRRAAAPGTTTA